MQPPVGSAPPSQLQTRTVAVRDLDGLEFLVIIIGLEGEEADVVYLDDGNLERHVPLDELETLSSEDERSRWGELHEQRWNAGCALMAEDRSVDASRPTTASMRWEQGRYVDTDGAVIVSAAAEAVEELAVLAKDSDAAVLAAAAPAACLAAAAPGACGAGLRGIRNLRRNRPQAPPTAA